MVAGKHGEVLMELVTDTTFVSLVLKSTETTVTVVSITILGLWLRTRLSHPYFSELRDMTIVLTHTMNERYDHAIMVQNQVWRPVVEYRLGNQ